MGYYEKIGEKRYDSIIKYYRSLENNEITKNEFIQEVASIHNGEQD